MDAAAVIATVKSTQALFVMLVAVGLTLYKWPSHVAVADNAKYDYLVLGGGSSGSIVASRLSEDPHVKVLLIEAGDIPEFQSQYVGLVNVLLGSEMDWNFITENDGYSAQYHRNQYITLHAGKVLGGTSTLLHYFYLRGHPYDYKRWAKTASDDSWSWWNLLPYFKKHERLEDQYLINSDSSYFHGLNGSIAITRETRKPTLKYLKAFRDIGHQIKDDLNTNEAIGFAQSTYYLSKDGIRQNSAECFLVKAKVGSNLHLMKKTTVRKILFDDHLNAIGVQCKTPDGKIINIYARKEIILSAGTLSTPKIMMLSGIGPKTHLEELGIPVLIDSPVGMNMQDLVTVVLTHKLEKTNDEVPPPNPSDVAAPTFVGMSALNKSQDFPDYITLNFILRNNPTGLLQLSSTLFGLHDDVSNQIAAAGAGREVLYTFLILGRPASKGRVLLRSSDPEDSPKILTGYYSNATDLENTAAYIKDFITVTKSSYFRSVGGETIHINLPRCKGLKPNTTEYWKCYALNMMDSTGLYSSTCSIGAVVDTRLRVKGVQKLRVADASIIPNQITGNILTASMAVAEKLVDMVKEDNC